MITYEQIQAIHDALESIERSRHVFDEAGDVIATSHGYGAGAVRDGIAKIRAALAGDTVEESDERMVRPEDVAPAVTERSEEDSKITWQG